MGKVLAGWCTGLTFLVAALPSVVPGAIAAGVGPIYLLSVLAMIAALTLCITAIGVGLSSLTARPLGAVVLAYLAVLGTTTILPTVASTAAPFLVVDHEVAVHTYADTAAPGTNDAPPGTFPVWPMGLGLHLLLAGGSIALATARINAPHRCIGAGTRIA